MAAAEVREAVERHPEVEAAYTVAGEASAVVHVRARTPRTWRRRSSASATTPGVTRTQTQIVLHAVRASF